MFDINYINNILLNNVTFSRGKRHYTISKNFETACIEEHCDTIRFFEVYHFLDTCVDFFLDIFSDVY